MRRAWRAGVCGADAININYRNGLVRPTNLRTLPRSIVLKPPPGLSAGRDQMVDMTQFSRRVHTVDFRLSGDVQAPEKAHLQRPVVIGRAI